VTVGTRWDLLGLAAAPLYQRVPTSPNSHKHFWDSNSLGGTTFSQVRGLSSPISRVKSGYTCLRAEGGGRANGQVRGGLDAFMRPNAVPRAHDLDSRTGARVYGLPVLRETGSP
jgi:hypothetical protein